MGFFPIVLELADRPCLVVGGGEVAERKVAALLDAGARVTVVSPTVTARLARWARRRRIVHVPRAWEPPDVAGHALLFVATDDRAVNADIAAETRLRGVWVNAADDPGHCDFILPSVLRRGALTVAVSTGGASPALAAAVRRELETYFTDGHAALADVAGAVRRELRAAGRSADGAAWRRALGPALRALVAAGRDADARAHLRERLEARPCR